MEKKYLKDAWSKEYIKFKVTAIYGDRLGIELYSVFEKESLKRYFKEIKILEEECFKGDLSWEGYLAKECEYRKIADESIKKWREEEK